MGDIADWLLEQAWDDGPDYYGDQDDNLPFYRDNKRCWYCKKIGLYWKEYNHGWRLTEPDGTIHVCKEYPGGNHGNET